MRHSQTAQNKRRPLSDGTVKRRRTDCCEQNKLEKGLETGGRNDSELFCQETIDYTLTPNSSVWDWETPVRHGVTLCLPKTTTARGRRIIDQRPERCTRKGIPIWRCPHGIDFTTYRQTPYSTRRLSSTCPKCCLFVGRSTKEDLAWVRQDFGTWIDDYIDEDPYDLNLSTYEVTRDNLTVGQNPLAGITRSFWDDIRWSDHYDNETGFNFTMNLLFGPSGNRQTLLGGGRPPCQNMEVSIVVPEIY